jgi:excisionase family DNA binding protein
MSVRVRKPAPTGIQPDRNRLDIVMYPHSAYTIAEACAIAGIRRTTLYKNIRAGQLRAIKVGARTLILADDLRRWLDGMPSVIGDPRSNGENASEPSVLVAASAENQEVSKPNGDQ